MLGGSARMPDEISKDEGPKGTSGTRRVFVLVGLAAAIAAGIGGAGLYGGLAGGQDRQSQVAEPEPTAPVCQVQDRASLVPASGALFGVNLDWQTKSLERYAFDLGHKPAVSVYFTPFPYSADEKTDLERAVVQIRANGQMLLLTLEPSNGLAGVTPESAEALAKDLAEFNNDGVPVLLRFGHEMNGSWYPWAQQPAQYIEAFRTIAAAVHAHAPGSAMMWAPSYGGGYPFAGGQYEAKAGSPEYAALDTDADGSLTTNDDSYAPYYPGDDAVDWVGMSLYHWGGEFPWGENELPEPNKFAHQLTGNYSGANGDDSALPDFYQVYGEAHGKPVAITETAALFNPAGGGEAELAIKQSWWGQLFDPATAARFPQLKMINWFEWDRDEEEIKGRVDWTVTNTPAVRDAFVAALPAWLRYGPAESCRPRS
jgi:hypothetical protein